MLDPQLDLTFMFDDEQKNQLHQMQMELHNLFKKDKELENLDAPQRLNSVSNLIGADDMFKDLL